MPHWKEYRCMTVLKFKFMPLVQDRLKGDNKIIHIQKFISGSVPVLHSACTGGGGHDLCWHSHPHTHADIAG